MNDAERRAKVRKLCKKHARILDQAEEVRIKILYLRAMCKHPVYKGHICDVCGHDSE